MLTTLIATFVFFAVLVAAMAIGVILSNKPIKGSCGGIGATSLKEDCFCGKKAGDQCDGPADKTDIAPIAR